MTAAAVVLNEGPGPRRAPPVVEFDRRIAPVGHQFLRQRIDGRVAAMTVHDQDLPEPCPADRCEGVAHHRQQRFHSQRHRDGVFDEIGRKAEGHHRPNRSAQRFIRIQRHLFGQHHVDAKRQLRMLFD